MGSLSGGQAWSTGLQWWEGFILMVPAQQRSSFEEPVGNCGAGLGIQEEEQGSKKHSCLEGQGKGPLVLPASSVGLISLGPWSTGTTGGDAAWL